MSNTTGEMGFILKIQEAAMTAAAICLLSRFSLGLPVWAWILLFFSPDISMIGYLFNPRVGAYTYNIVHHRAIALIVAAIGLFIANIGNALMNNYSVCWDGDVHEGYQNGFCRLAKEEKVTQQARQTAFDNYTTQDDHNMHIIGIAEDSQGKRFYIAKNSSAGSDCGGYVYMSKEYLLLKTISVMVHKDALPKAVVAKVNAARY
jgi:hypothetical protein